jgi:hypothetical protein
MRVRHKDITDSIDSTFDPEKISEWFKEYAAGIKPKRVVTFDILEKCRGDIKKLVLIGTGPAEIAKGFALRGLPVSAATMKLFIDLRIKRKPGPKQDRRLKETGATSEATSAPKNEGASSGASPAADKKDKNIIRI